MLIKLPLIFYFLRVMQYCIKLSHSFVQQIFVDTFLSNVVSSVYLRILNLCVFTVLNIFRINQVIFPVSSYRLLSSLCIILLTIAEVKNAHLRMYM